MFSIPKNEISVKPWFFSFIFLHVSAWTLVPTFFRYTLPLDAIEGATWGRQLEWGYDKNPFMNAWLTELGIHLGRQGDWVIYLLSQLSIALSFLAVWLLAKKILPPLYALLAVVLLEGVHYYNLHAIDFSDNSLEIGIWAVTILFFYRALCQNKLVDWLLTGTFAGLAMMTKYYSVVLLFPMVLFVLLNPVARKNLKNPYLYMGASIFILIITPHIIWLCTHEFITLKYAIGRVSLEAPRGYDHLFFPAEFTWQQLQAISPILLLLLIFFLGEKPLRLQPKILVSTFNKEFLAYLGIGPFLVTILLSALLGLKLRAAWGQPLFSLWGIIFVLWLQPHVTKQKFIRFVVVLLSLMAMALLGYSLSLSQARQPSSANYPGREIAAELTQLWHEKYHTPLKYVAGGRWLAGNISYYSSDRPAVFIEWNKKLSPWIDEAALKRDGAIFVWDLSQIHHVRQVSHKEIKSHFPDLSNTEDLRFLWLRNKKMPPVQLQVAFLPPTGMRKSASFDR